MDTFGGTLSHSLAKVGPNSMQNSSFITGGVKKYCENSIVSTTGYKLLTDSKL